jgi:glycolate oxidase FAD binding subunit
MTDEGSRDEGRIGRVDGIGDAGATDAGGAAASMTEPKGSDAIGTPGGADAIATAAVAAAAVVPGRASAAIASGDPALARLVDQVLAARAVRGRLAVCGGGSKAFHGEPPPSDAVRLDTRALAGISSYEPTELVVTARAGTPLAELEALLAQHGQCLPFEPPHFGAAADVSGEPGAAPAAPVATVGGMVAAGLAGPARAAVGGVRDYVLGATLLNGRGELLSFGGQVMKNVAGYDVSRLLAGSMGALGVICEVSLKVLPVAPARLTLRFEMDEATAIRRLNEWAGQPLPLNASAWWEGTLVLRLAGAVAAVHAAAQRLGGEVIEATLAEAFWAGLRDQRDEFFDAVQRAVAGGASLWRLSLPPTTPPLQLPGELLIEWGGAQRWLCTNAPAADLREAATRAGGHATLFRRGVGTPAAVPVFTPLPAVQQRIQTALRRAFDPDGVFGGGALGGASGPGG